MTFLLEGQKVRARLGAATILDQVNIHIAPKEIVTLIGPNGSGKTTLLKALLGLIRVEGKILRRPGLKIGYVPQHFARDASLPMTVDYFLKLFAGEIDADAA